MSDESRIEQELSGDEYTYKSRIEEFIAWLNEDIPTHPEPKSRIEEQLAAMTPGGGGSATLIEKTITENGVYKASDDQADGYSKVSVEVPDSGAYFGIPVAKTFADSKYFDYEEFPNTDYSSNDLVVPDAMKQLSLVKSFDNVSTPSSSETILTWGNCESKAYLYDSDTSAITMTGARDYFRVLPTTPWAAAYIKNSNAALVCIPRQYSNGYQTHMCLVYCMADTIKTTIWNVDYSLKYRRFLAWGNRATGYTEFNQNICGNNMLLIPIFNYSESAYTEGIYEVVCGNPQINGFYEVGGQLFYICAGIAIKDE